MRPHTSAYVVCCSPTTKATFDAVSEAHRLCRDCDVYIITHGGTSTLERHALEQAVLKHRDQSGVSHVVLGHDDHVRHGAFSRVEAWATTHKRLGEMIVAWCLSEPDYFLMLRERYVGARCEIVVKTPIFP